MGRLWLHLVFHYLLRCLDEISWASGCFLRNLALKVSTNLLKVQTGAHQALQNGIILQLSVAPVQMQVARTSFTDQMLRVQVPH